MDMDMVLTPNLMLSPFDDLRVHGHQKKAERARLTELVGRPPQVRAVDMAMSVCCPHET